MAWLLAVLLLQSAQPAVPDPATIDDAGTITVTATKISDLADAARACEQYRCSTRKDVAVTVAYASALFDAGNYLEAKRLLAAGVARVKGAARQEPMAVSQIYTAQATLSMHEGDQDTTRAASWASRNVLADAPSVRPLPKLVAEARLADWQYRVGQKVDAEARYADIVRVATVNGLQPVANSAVLRRAMALNALGRRSESVALLEGLAARTDPQSADARRAALAMASRQAFEAGDLAAADAFSGRLAAIAGTVEPLLVSSPPMPRPGALTSVPLGDLLNADRGANGSALVGLRWVDVGFWIKPDGQVDDVSILRGSDQLGWATPLIGHVKARRYSAFAVQAGDIDGRYRVERYTLTADYSVPIGSLVRRRVRNPRFELMEMTNAAPPMAAAN